MMRHDADQARALCADQDVVLRVHLPFLPTGVSVVFWVTSVLFAAHMDDEYHHRSTQRC